MSNSYFSIMEPIIYTASRLEVIANRCFFSPIGVSFSNVKILGLLCRKKAMTPKEIIELIGGTKSNISQRLNFLEKKGYLKMYRNVTKDKREVLVKLTLSGGRKLQEIKKQIKKAKLEIEANFSQKEIENHFAFFEKLNKLVDLKEKEILKNGENCIFIQ